MPYTAKARALRRCTHVYAEGHARAGETCRAFALWDDPHGRCAPHAGRTRGAERVVIDAAAAWRILHGEPVSTLLDALAAEARATEARARGFTLPGA